MSNCSYMIVIIVENNEDNNSKCDAEPSSYVTTSDPRRNNTTIHINHDRISEQTFYIIYLYKSLWLWLCNRIIINLSSSKHLWFLSSVNKIYFV